MSIALLITDRNLSALCSGLEKHLPGVNIQCWPNITAPEKVKLVVAWQQPENCWHQFSNLQAVHSLGAGCDGLLNDKFLPQNIAVMRIIDPGLSEQMAEYVLTSILMIKRRFNHYVLQQKNKNWQALPTLTGRNITILGVGNIGDYVAHHLLKMGYQVKGWSKNKKQQKPYQTYNGLNELEQAVFDADFLVSILPLTTETDQFLNKALFSLLPNNTWLINVGRGQVLNEGDLLDSLTNKQLQGAVLDVFANEPLISSHPFWLHDKIMITPHIAAITDQQAIISQIIKNYLALSAGKELVNVVNRASGY